MITVLKKYKIIVFALLALILLGTGAFGGYTFCKRAQYKGVINQQAKDATTVMEHEEKKDVAEKELDKVIEVRVEKAGGTSGCLNTPSPDAYLDGLLDADRKAKSSFN